MKAVLCYIAVTGGSLTEEYAARFVTTYHEFPPGIEHQTIVIANGGLLPRSIALLFSSIGASMWPHENDAGWDISAYIAAAKGPCAGADMMLCLGESVHFHREGWFKRLHEAWQRHGPGMYGPFASHTLRAHLNTTAFCCHPRMLRQYPARVTTRQDRYAFEHGPQALWRRLYAQRIPVRMVTWDGEWEPKTWRVPNNILWRGDQSNCLMWCNHTERFAEADYRTKLNWLRTCDQPFK